jgi:hypothetical protein
MRQLFIRYADRSAYSVHTQLATSDEASYRAQRYCEVRSDLSYRKQPHTRPPISDRCHQ